MLCFHWLSKDVIFSNYWSIGVEAGFLVLILNIYHLHKSYDGKTDHRNINAQEECRRGTLSGMQ